MITINMKLEIQGPLDFGNPVLYRELKADRMYLQDGDEYELWADGPVGEVDRVVWGHDFTYVNLLLRRAGDEHMVDRCLRAGWSAHGHDHLHMQPRPWTWGTVPLGYFVAGRGYVTRRVDFGEGIAPDEVIVEFSPEEGSLIVDRFACQLKKNGEVR